MFHRYFREWMYQYHHIHPTQLETIEEVSEYIYIKLKVILIIARTARILPLYFTTVTPQSIISAMQMSNYVLTPTHKYITAAKQLRRALASTAPVSPICSRPPLTLPTPTPLCHTPRTPLIILSVSSLWNIVCFPKLHMVW
jgi:hypothetical protein